MTIPVIRSQTVRILTGANCSTKAKLYTCRFFHRHHKPIARLPSMCGYSVHRTKYLMSSIFVKFNSTVATESLPNIPEPPLPIDAIPPSVQLQVTGDPSFASIGLGGWSPTGILESMFEQLHIMTGLPWWATIVTGALLLRLGTSYYFIKGQQLHARHLKHQPAIERFQKRLTESQTAGEMSEVSLIMQEQQIYMKRHDLSIFRLLSYSLVQGAVNLTAFLAVRHIHNSSIESLGRGGIYWFRDLTVPDPYYILPVITCGLLAVMAEISTQTSGMTTSPGYVLFLRLSPLLCLPFMIMFPAGQQIYWIAINIATLSLQGLLRVPRVRQSLRLEPIPTVQKKQGSIMDQFREFQTQMQESSRLKSVQGNDDSFYKAGRGPIPRTFAENPLKPLSAERKRRSSG